MLKKTRNTPTSSGVTQAIERNYGYTDSEWGDLLTSLNGSQITYDEIGNPLSYRGYTFTWEGRRLVGAIKDNDNMSFTYNDEGLRTGKAVDRVTTTYVWNGTQLYAEISSTYIIVFMYEADGSPLGMQYLNTLTTGSQWEVYWYLKRTVLMC